MKLNNRSDIKIFLQDRVYFSVGWGRKKSGIVAQREALNQGAPYLLLEDGFLRSIERNDPPSSIGLDDQGIYYDATAPSRMEELVRSPLDEQQRKRVTALISMWRDSRVSKYNSEREYQGNLPERYVLVCDQTFGDLSIHHGLADEASFGRMLTAALRENPEATIVVKTHPDRFTRRKKGYFTTAIENLDPRIRVITEPCHPVRLIEYAKRVYCVTSQMGFEALLWGKPVRTFGMPFYAGWGLTDDDLAAPMRRQPASLEQLAHAALVAYPRYVDPETDVLCEPERIISYFAHQRRMRERYAPIIQAIGFSIWKRPILRRFLSGSDLHFRRRPSRSPKIKSVAVWGSREIRMPSSDTDIIRIEDGFLRSVGLGADLVRPISWVCDDVGIYYDAARPSSLEILLSQTKFDQALLDRAAKLRESIIERRLTKYNTAGSDRSSAWERPQHASRVILVPGQVEEDASIRLGAFEIHSNVALLQAARRRNPDAYIVYKPHPDVVAGLRRKGKNEAQAEEFCDEVIVDVDMASMLANADEVHTMTSLSGFEALMRGIDVTCYGLPFYAGWGLTTDLIAADRRKRSLTLDELIAGALILYPTYVSSKTGRYTTPERAIEELAEWKTSGISHLPVWRRALRVYIQYRNAAVDFLRLREE